MLGTASYTHRCALDGQTPLHNAVKTTHDHHAQSDTAHCGLGTPTSVTNQENALQICPRAKLMEAVLELRVPFSRCVKLAIKIRHYTCLATQSGRKGRN